jgi:heme-degrading monooxygenase HmoA
LEGLERMFCYIWEFRASPLRIEEFESAYEPNGLWARLFRKAPGYIRTELLKDPGETNRYLTVDYWIDRKVYERFRLDFRAEFQSLDKACEAYTESERLIGDFEVR